MRMMSFQEACLAAWRYRHRFDPEQGSFQTWLLKILLNESYKTVARRRRHGLLLTSRTLPYLAIVSIRGPATWCVILRP